MTPAEDVQVADARNQLEESYKILCAKVRLFNTSQMEKRKAHFINALEAADVESSLSPSFIERARENALQTFPLKAISDEIPQCLTTSQVSTRSSQVSPEGGSRKKQKSSQSACAPSADSPTSSPTRPTWSGTASVASSNGTAKIVPMDDLKINLVLSGVDRTLDFSQRISQPNATHNGQLHMSFATVKRIVGISVIRECFIENMVAWASKQLDVMSCKSFGISHSKLKTRGYWTGVVKRGTHFVVFLDHEIVGYIPCFNINTLDNLGVPAHYGATQRRTITVKNLACIGYIKSLPRVDKDDRGVMQFAVRHVINWLLEAEPRLTGCIAVIKIPNSDAESSKPAVIEYLQKSRHLVDSLNMKCQAEFRGSHMGEMNAYLLLREDVS